MRFIGRFLILCSLALPCLAQTGKADTPSVTLLRSAVVEEGPASRGAVKLPVTLSGHSPLIGRFTIQLTKKRLRDWPAFFEDSRGRVTNDSSQLMLFRGRALIKRGGRKVNRPVAASVSNQAGLRTIQIHLEAELPRHRLVVLTGTRRGALSGKIEIRESRVSKAFLESTQCAELDSSHNPAAAIGTSPRAAVSAAKVIELATDADYQFYQNHGVNSNNAIATIVNAAQAIYQSGLNLEFQIVSQRVSTSPNSLTSTAPSTLLDQYGSFLSSNPHPVNYDVTHLFTGKDLNGSVVGIAWLSVVCRTSNQGLTQDLNNSTSPIIFAHEVGHNFGAGHDTGLPQSLMYPSAGPNAATLQNFFSSTSINQIQSYLNTYGACLAEASAGGTPTPTPTGIPTVEPTATPDPEATPSPAPTATPAVPKYRLKISKVHRRSFDNVTLRIRLPGGSPASQVAVQLLRLSSGKSAKLIKASLSSDNGSITVRIVKAGQYRFRVGERNQLSDIFSIRR